MTLPDEFKFNDDHCGVVYTAKLTDGKYRVTWFEECDGSMHSVGYFACAVGRFIATGAWTIRPESFSQLVTLAEGFQVLISEKKDRSDLAFDEMKALLLTRAIITRLLDGR